MRIANYNSDACYFEEEKIPVYWGGKDRWVVNIPASLLLRLQNVRTGADWGATLCADPSRPEVYDGGEYIFMEFGKVHENKYGWKY